MFVCVRERDRERQRERDKERDKERERQTERETERETEIRLQYLVIVLARGCPRTGGVVKLVHHQGNCNNIRRYS